MYQSVVFFDVCLLSLHSDWHETAYSKPAIAHPVTQLTMVRVWDLLWTLSSCLVTWDRVPKERLQREQRNGFSPRWRIRICFSRLNLLLQLALQMVHLKLRRRMCTALVWSPRWLLLPKRLPQPGSKHAKGLSLLWTMRMWRERWFCLLKDAVQLMMLQA